MDTPTIDEALDLLKNTGPEFGGGLSNHGPMAAEALFAMGRGEQVIPWLESYRRRLEEAPAASGRVDGSSWQNALGDYRRVGAWVAFFEREFQEMPWREAIARWVPRLTAGLAGAAMHGIIRTAHAARSLAAEETPARVEELARGLGYWAARYWELPRASELSGQLLPSEALPRVGVLPPREWSGRLIADGLAALQEDRRFPDAFGLVAVSQDSSSFLSDLTGTFAGTCLRNTGGFGKAVTFIHTVTGPSAARLLIPYLPKAAISELLRFSWYAAAAIYAAYGSVLGSKPRDSTVQTDDLADRALATGDEHVIKLTEACLREHAISPQPVYLRAAADAIERRTAAG